MASSRRRRSAEPDPLTALGAALAALGAAPRLAVAFSGGLDSTALLHAAAKLLPAGSLCAFHIDHGLQEGSADWAQHCEREARALGVALRVERLSGRPQPGESVEAWAREARYAALQRLAEAAAVDAVLTAHHADDQIETLLIRLARGAGLDGLAGIEADTLRGRMRLIRPWLELSRAQLRDWAVQAGLHWIEDPSNADTRLQRNAIRRRLLPVIDEVLPGLRKRLPDSLAVLREARDMLQALASRDLAAIEVHSREFGPSLSLSAWRALPPKRRPGVLRAWLAARGARMPSHARLAEMVRQLESPREDFACAIRHDGRMLRRYRDLVAIERADRPQPAADRASQADLPSGFGGIEIRWRGERRLEFPALNGNLLIEPVLTPGQAGLRAELLRSADLGLKPRCGGERLRTRSGGPHRSLKNLFQEQGVPAWQRVALPVLWAGGRPVWVPRLGFDAECASDSGERYALRWEARHDDDD